jgi:hypothetical protein
LFYSLHSLGHGKLSISQSCRQQSFCVKTLFLICHAAVEAAARGRKISVFVGNYAQRAAHCRKNVFCQRSIALAATGKPGWNLFLHLAT